MRDLFALREARLPDAEIEQEKLIMRIALLTGVLIAGASMLAGCSSDNTSTPGGTATTITVISGGTQTGIVGATALTPLVVEVTDVNGSPVVGTTVTFTASGGSLSSTSAVTNSSGEATVNFAFGTTIGADSVFATVSGVTTRAAFGFTASAGSASKIVLISGNSQTAVHGTATALPLVVHVTDSLGNVVSGATVLFTTTGGTLGTASVVTDVNGSAQSSFTLPATAGVSTVTATLQGTAQTAVFSETGT